MNYEVPYIFIAPIASILIQFVSSFTITTHDNKPSKIVFNIAMDSEKAGTDQVEFPVFLPVEGNYPNTDLKRMKESFQSGEPFVAVTLHNLKVYRKEEANRIGYFGFADSFKLVDNPKAYLEEEDLL